MKKRFVNVFFLVAFTFTIVLTGYLSPGSAVAQESTNNKMVYKRSESDILIRDDNVLEWIHLQDGNSSKKITFNNIYDMKVLSNPNKIIVLTQNNSGKLQKQVFNFKGGLLSKYDYPLNMNKGDKIKWIAPVNGKNEQVMFQQDKQFSLYQAPWKKAVLSFHAQVKDMSGEYVSIEDWDYTSYPYLAIKYSVDRIMGSDYFVRIINLYSKKYNDIHTLNTSLDFNMSINEQNRLEITTSYIYEDPRPANLNLPESSDEQQVYTTYSLASGKELYSVKSRYLQLNNQISGWSSQVVNGILVLHDLGANVWSLYYTNGEIIKENIKLSGREDQYLSYNSSSNTLYTWSKDENTSLYHVQSMVLE